MHEVRIDGLGAGGDGVGRLDDGQVIFIPGAFPGDRVRVAVESARKKVVFGRLLNVVERSADRVESRCKASQCGGCASKGLALAAQGHWKRQRLVDNLKKIAHVDAEAWLGGIWQFGDGWRYRHRVRLQARWRSQRWQLGYHRRRSHDLVPLRDCPVLWPELEQICLRLGSAVAALPADIALQDVEVVYSRRDASAAARVRLRGGLAAMRPHVEPLAQHAGLRGVEVVGEHERLRHGKLELRYDHPRADAFDLLFEPGTFTQAHPEANARLVESVMHWVQPQNGARVLELHAGVGNFSLPLARAGAHLTAVESAPRAAILGRRNVRHCGLASEFRQQADVEAAMDAGAYECVVLDPPRGGARAAVERLAAARPPRVVYISCDAATLARDAALLCAAGYSISGAECFDLFPQTPHVESLWVFELGR